MKQLIEFYITEHTKNKRRHLPLVLLGTLLFQTAFMLWNMSRQSNYLDGWMAQLYNMPILNAILLPTVISVFASRLMDTEHKAHSLKLLKTLQSSNRLLAGKLIYGFINILFFCMGQLTGLYFVGNYYHFPNVMPTSKYGLYFIGTLLTCFVLFILQLLLSFLWANQAVSLSIGLCGSLIGIFINFLPRGILYKLIPWGFFVATGIVAMDWNEKTRVAKLYFTEPLNGSFAAIALWIIFLLLLCFKLFSAYETEGFSFVLPIHFHKNAKNASTSNAYYNFLCENIKYGTIVVYYKKHRRYNHG